MAQTYFELNGTYCERLFYTLPLLKAIFFVLFLIVVANLHILRQSPDQALILNGFQGELYNCCMSCIVCM